MEGVRSHGGDHSGVVPDQQDLRPQPRLYPQPRRGRAGVPAAPGRAHQHRLHRVVTACA
jgi:hypothetical protein